MERRVTFHRDQFHYQQIPIKERHIYAYKNYKINEIKMGNANLSPNVGVEDGDQHDVLHDQPLRGQHVLHHALNTTKQINH